jgi:hypothetical protein
MGPEILKIVIFSKYGLRVADGVLYTDYSFFTRFGAPWGKGGEKGEKRGRKG